MQYLLQNQHAISKDCRCLRSHSGCLLSSKYILIGINAHNRCDLWQDFIEPIPRVCIEKHKVKREKGGPEKSLHRSKPSSLQTDVKKTLSYNGKY